MREATDGGLMYKVCVVGSGGVGKSCLTLRFFNQSFSDEYDPTIEDSYRKQIDLDGKSIILDILDTAGQEGFSAMRDEYMQSGEGFVIVYAVNIEATFEEAQSFRRQIQRVQDKDNIPMILVGNKCDLPEEQRAITREQGEAEAARWQVGFFETSAKNNVNVQEVFHAVARAIDAERKRAARGEGGEQEQSGSKRGRSKVGGFRCVLV
ncbi:Ras-related protein rsr1 [Balamuthia mandrillaris]